METGYAAGIVLAGGSGTRVGAGMNKVFINLAGKPAFIWSLQAFDNAPEISELVLVVRAEDYTWAQEITAGYAWKKPLRLVEGGNSRAGSELNGLELIAARAPQTWPEVALLHDAARPLVTPELIASVCATAKQHGGAVPGVADSNIMQVAATDGAVQTEKSANSNCYSHKLVELAPLEVPVIRVQTPQGFRFKELLEAYRAASAVGYEGTDTAATVREYSELEVLALAAPVENFKVTYAEDVAVAEKLLG